MLFTRESQLLSILPSSFDDDTKPRVLAAVRVACIAHDASILSQIGEAWCLIGEAWCLIAEPGFSILTARPSQSERRIEIAFVCTAWCEGNERRILFTGREIIRNATGGVDRLGRNIMEDKGTAMAGHMTELLPTCPPDRAARRRAAHALEQLCNNDLIRVFEFQPVTSN